MPTDFFRYKRVNFNKLTEYGFKKSEKNYNFKTNILDGQFNLTVKVNENGLVKTELIENETGEIYTLHLVDSAQGTFVGDVRNAYSEILEEIATKCFDNQFFQSQDAYAIIDYVRKKYGDEAEYLWEKFPNNAIFRRKDNQKWYGAILSAKWSNFGFDSPEPVEVLDLRIDTDKLEELLQNGLYPAYHMNKKHWASIILDGQTPLEKIFSLLDNSYILAKKK